MDTFCQTSASEGSPQALKRRVIASLVNRPEAAVPEVGAMNPLRGEHQPTGPANIPEFGTTTNEDDFKGLLEMDPVAHVKPGVRYPAVLLTAGINDSRVEAWDPAKMAAAMQEVAAPDRPVLLRVAFDAGWCARASHA